MVFELYKKQIRYRRRLLDNQVAVSKTCISFGKDIFKDSSNINKYVLIYIDRDNNRVGLKLCNNIMTGYALTIDTKSGRRRIQKAKNVVNILPIGIYNAEFIDGMWVINVKKFNEEHSKN